MWHGAFIRKWRPKEMAKPECPYTSFCEKIVGKCDREMGMSEIKLGKLSKAYSLGFFLESLLIGDKDVRPLWGWGRQLYTRSSTCFRERTVSPCCSYCFSIFFSLKYSTWHHICSELGHCKANTLITLGTPEWFGEKQASGILWHKWVMKLEPLLHYGKWESRFLLLSCYNHCWERNG